MSGDAVPVEQYEAMRKRREQALSEAPRVRRELEAIVRHLAAESPPLDGGGNDLPFCHVCGNWFSDAAGRQRPGDGHDPKCAYVRAKAWVEANPETDRG